MAVGEALFLALVIDRPRDKGRRPIIGRGVRFKIDPIGIPPFIDRFKEPGKIAVAIPAGNQAGPEIRFVFHRI